MRKSKKADGGARRERAKKRERARVEKGQAIRND